LIFTNGDQGGVVTASLGTTSGTFPIAPTSAELFIQCTNTDSGTGYSTGDIIDINAWNGGAWWDSILFPTNSDAFVSLSFDGLNWNIAFSSRMAEFPPLIQPTGNAIGYMTSTSNFEWYIRYYVQ